MSKKKKKKRVNPNRIPMSKAEALQSGQDIGLRMAMAIIFAAELDGGHITPEQMPDIWRSVNYLSDSINKGYVNAVDILRMLDKEYEINLF